MLDKDRRTENMKNQPKEKKEITPVKQASITPENKEGISIEQLLKEAVANKTPIGTVERIMAMRQQLKTEWAKEQFDKAMADFQFECPIINKTKEVKTKAGQVAYKYAPIEEIVSQVKALIQKHGFSYKTNMDNFVENGETKIRATVKVTHSAGHSEETSMTVPLGNKTDIMSQSQVVAAATTFAKRYAFINAFGILTGDEDNEAILRQSEVLEEEKVPEDAIQKINEAKTNEELVAVCKEITDKNPKLRKALITHYTRRKNELNTDQIVEDADKALNGGQQNG
jgi:hypothetical protein